MVVGFLTGKDNLKRKFSQTFYLAPQDKAYVVVNDMYRFVDEEESSLPPTVVESGKWWSKSSCIHYFNVFLMDDENYYHCSARS